MKRIVTLLLCLCVLMPLSAAPIETIQLHHRLADEILPQITPFLPKDAVAQAYGDKIIIKADKASLEQIKKLLQQLDVPQQSLIVSVMKTKQALDSDQHNQSSIAIEAGDTNQAAATVQHWSTRDNTAQNRLYKARGMSERPVAIMIGQDIPEQDNLLIFGPYGQVGVQNTTRYISLNSGFQALSHILPNNRVRVDILPIFSQQDPSGQIDTSAIQSTVMGQLGQWMELGLVAERQAVEQQGVKHYRSHQQEQQHIYLKVELAPVNQ